MCDVGDTDDLEFQPLDLQDLKFFGNQLKITHNSTEGQFRASGIDVPISSILLLLSIFL